MSEEAKEYGDQVYEPTITIEPSIENLVEKVVRDEYEPLIAREVERRLAAVKAAVNTPTVKPRRTRKDKGTTRAKSDATR